MARLDVLRDLSKTSDILDNKAAEQQAAAARLQFQQAATQIPQAGGTRQAAQALAAPAVAAEAAPQLQAQQQQTQRAAKLQEVEAREQARVQQASLKNQQALVQKELIGKEIASARYLSGFGIDQDNRLLATKIQDKQDIAELEAAVGEQIFNSRKNFAEDEMGRKFMETRQLADWTVSNAVSKEDFVSKMQIVEQEHVKKMNLLKAINLKLERELGQEAAAFEQGLNLEHKKKLVEAKAKVEKQIAESEADAANTRSIIQGAFTVGGAIIGGLTAGPVGAGVGGTVGAGLGNIFSGIRS